MDAVEYVKQRERMCNYYTNCTECPAGYCEECSSLNGVSKLVPIVEQWSKEHPVKTRQSEFLKQWPEVTVDKHGVCNLEPCNLCPSMLNSDGCGMSNCDKCRCDFWLKEIE